MGTMDTSYSFRPRPHPALADPSFLAVTSAFIEQPGVIEKILTPLGVWPTQVDGLPASAAAA